MEQIITSLLETDMYKFSMGQAIYHHYPEYMTTWDFKCRNKDVHFTKEMVDEIRRQIRLYCHLRFKEDELKYLDDIKWIKGSYVNFLRLWRPNYADFTIDNKAECGLRITTKGTWLNTSMYEIPTLAIVNEVYFRMHYDYDELMKFKTEYCIGVLDNYDVVHYDNGKDQVKIGEADKSKRKCRFCGRMMPEVSYKKIAHTISEGLGNKCIITNDECDDCNETLGKEIEQDLITYLSPLRTFMSINGKNGKGKIKDDSFALYEDGPKSMKFDLFEKVIPEEKYWKFERDGDNFKLSFTHPQMVNPQDVYRAVVKYAIGVMDEAQLPYFEGTIKWIRKEWSATELPRLCFFLDQHPGREGKPCIAVFTRKNGDWSLPYSYVELQVAGVVIFAIIPFCDQDDISFSQKEDWTHTMDVLKIYRKMPFLKSIAPNKDETERIMYNFDFKKWSEVE